MSFLPHPSRGRHAVDEQPADDERINDERINDERVDGEEPAATAPDSQQPAGERPRYAFGYAPDDVAADDAAGGNVVRGDNVVHSDNVVRGDVVREDEDEDYPPVTVSDVPGDTGAAADVRDTPVPAPRAAGEYEPAAGYEPTPTFEPAPGYEPTPAFEPAAGYETAATEQQAAATGTANGTALDEPLLADAAGLRTRWQQAQANFVDDPRAAVTDAAALVEQTAQALIDGLEQRQRQLRQQWERGQAGDPNAPAGEPPDTERLRLTMRRYRALFDQLCVR